MIINNIAIPDLKELARFLVKAKKSAWAGEGREIEPQRPGFNELEFIEGDWNYRDSYVGYYCAPGQEIVRFKGRPVWAMSYDGGTRMPDWGNLDYARYIFGHLKKALLLVTEDIPFRGPSEFVEGELSYRCDLQGSITRFNGSEWIKDDASELIESFRQNYIGGLIIPK